MVKKKKKARQNSRWTDSQEKNLRGNHQERVVNSQNKLPRNNIITRFLIIMVDLNLATHRALLILKTSSIQVLKEALADK